MKPVERSAFFLIPATALATFGLRKIGSALSHFTFQRVWESENAISFITVFLLTCVAAVSGICLIFRIRIAYYLSVLSAGALLAFGLVQCMRVSAEASRLPAEIQKSLVSSTMVEIVFLGAIFVLLLLKATRNVLSEENNSHPRQNRE